MHGWIRYGTTTFGSWAHLLAPSITSLEACCSRAVFFLLILEFYSFLIEGFLFVWLQINFITQNENLNLANRVHIIYV
jgi:hypothetical protein